MEAIIKPIKITRKNFAKYKLNIDITKISLALRNLIENALKYGSNKKPVEIQTTIFNTNWIDIHVKDYGLGISDENIEKITNPFFEYIRKDV